MPTCERQRAFDFAASCAPALRNAPKAVDAIDELYAAWRADAAAGEDAFFSEIRRRALAAMRRRGLKDAEEAAQAALVSVWLSLPAYRAQSPFSHWLNSLLWRRGMGALKRELRLKYAVAQSIRAI